MPKLPIMSQQGRGESRLFDIREDEISSSSVALKS